jgi:hypothetical protein
MKLEIYQDGILKLTLEGVAAEDVVYIPKNISSECCMRSGAFEDLFFKCLKDSHTNLEAYEKAEGIHEQYLGKRKYSDYMSFANVRYQRHKK